MFGFAACGLGMVPEVALCVLFLMDPQFFRLVHAEGDAGGRSVVTVAINNSGLDVILAVTQQMRAQVPGQQMSKLLSFSLSATE